MTAAGNTFTYGSVCSGIEAATVAWQPLGWKAAWFSEIEPFPNAVLAHHYPHTPNLGDMTQLYEKETYRNTPIDLLVGGTPCQSFSVAGLRGGMADPRGNLALHFLRIVDEKRPRWVVWENVPGVLSSWSDAEAGDEGCVWQTNDFDTFLCGLRYIGYGVAWRILDAQYFGVPQRRRRVFVVGYIGDWRPAAAVLFERQSLSGNPAPSRKTGKGASADIAPSLRKSGIGVHRIGHIDGLDPVVAFNAEGSEGFPSITKSNLAKQVNNQTPAMVFDCSPLNNPNPLCFRQNSRDEVRFINGDGQIAGALSSDLGAKQQNYVLVHGTQDPIISDIAFPLGTNGGQENVVIAPTLTRDDMEKKWGNNQWINNWADALQEIVVKQVQWASGGGDTENDTAQALRSNAEHNYQFLRIGKLVRRLTPTECERLQGFPDGYTDVPGYDSNDTGKYGGNHGVPDGPRYAYIGNSMPVPVMRWVGGRIKKINDFICNI